MHQGQSVKCKHTHFIQNILLNSILIYLSEAEVKKNIISSTSFYFSIHLDLNVTIVIAISINTIAFVIFKTKIVDTLRSTINDIISLLPSTLLSSLLPTSLL